MKNVRTSGGKTDGAFTLIELLVVIAIIAILAAMIFPAVKMSNVRMTHKKVQTEMSTVKMAIELYKEKYNSYPPDNPGQVALNPLYYELCGTTLAGGTYSSLDGGEQIAASAVPTAFGPTVAGFVNCTRSGADDASSARDFLKGMKTGQYVKGLCNGVTNRLLVCSVQWPKGQPPLVPAFTPFDANVKPNPWRYNSSSPTHNVGGYDLWVDVVIAGKTNRISNWSVKPEVL